MNQTSIKKIGLTILATLACGTLMAQDTRTVVGSGKQIVMPSSSVVIPYRDVDSIDANVLIAQNLGPTTTNLYIIDNGWLVTGPSDVTFGGPFSVAVQFTTGTAAVHAKILEAAITFYEGTAKRLRLGIYTASAGAVGTLILDGSTAVIPTFGTCCVLSKVTLAGVGAALAASTPYFLVATVDSTTPDAGLVWDFVPPFGGGANGQSFNNVNTGGVWDAEWTYYAAYRVRGTNP